MNRTDANREELDALPSSSIFFIVPLMFAIFLRTIKENPSLLVTLIQSVSCVSGYSKREGQHDAVANSSNFVHPSRYLLLPWLRKGRWCRVLLLKLARDFLAMWHVKHLETEFCCLNSSVVRACDCRSQGRVFKSPLGLFFIRSERWLTVYVFLVEIDMSHMQKKKNFNGVGFSCEKNWSR